MAYNPMFPATYQPYYQQQIPQTMPTNAPQNNSSIIWVQGEAGAKSYLVAPNNTVQLWDSESQTIYLKSADASGMPSMKVLDYKIRNQEPVAVPANLTEINPSYATKDEVTELKSELTRLKDELHRITEGKSHDAE